MRRVGFFAFKTFKSIGKSSKNKETPILREEEDGEMPLRTNLVVNKLVAENIIKDKSNISEKTYLENPSLWRS